MRKKTAILILVTFLPMLGFGGGLLTVCDEGRTSHIELVFARCCDSGNHEGHQAAGDVGGTQLNGAACGTCVDRPISFDTLPHVTVSNGSVRPLAFAPVMIVLDHCNDPPIDLTTFSLANPWKTPGEALRAPIDSVVLRC